MFIRLIQASHVVIMLDELSENIKHSIDKQGIQEICEVIRNHELFAPLGTNVNFVTLQDKHTISIRKYERGVEMRLLPVGQVQWQVRSYHLLSEMLNHQFM